MLRSKLRNKFLKNRSNGRLTRNNEIYAFSLLRQNKKDCFEILDVKSVIDNKMFWKTVAPLLSNKSKISNKLTSSEHEKLIINTQKNALKCSITISIVLLKTKYSD